MMKIRSEYSLREMAGEHVVVIPGGGETSAPTRIVALNPSACYLWESFRGREFSADDVARALEARYDVEPGTARRDARRWIDRLADCGIIEA
ncbi:PqqD family protein [Alistipes sp.]|uniref:PqqD family protein n=1 Tax=Alistipes sp. TaxID=1872444 RepID=UPI003A8ADADC